MSRDGGKTQLLAPSISYFVKKKKSGECDLGLINCTSTCNPLHCNLPGSPRPPAVINQCAFRKASQIISKGSCATLRVSRSLALSLSLFLYFRILNISGVVCMMMLANHIWFVCKLLLLCNLLIDILLYYTFGTFYWVLELWFKSSWSRVLVWHPHVKKLEVLPHRHYCVFVSDATFLFVCLKHTFIFSP